MDSTLTQKILLAFRVLIRWEVLVTLAGFLFIWLILRSVADPDRQKPKPIKFQQKKKLAPMAEAEPESETEEGDDAPRSRRASRPADDEDDEELVK